MLPTQGEIQFSEHAVLYDMLVPKDHVLRQINDLIDFGFVYRGRGCRPRLHSGCCQMALPRNHGNGFPRKGGFAGRVGTENAHRSTFRCNRGKSRNCVWCHRPPLLVVDVGGLPFVLGRFVAAGMAQNCIVCVRPYSSRKMRLYWFWQNLQNIAKMFIFASWT